MTHDELVVFWGYDPAEDVADLKSVLERIRKQPAVVVAAMGAALGLVMLGIGDLTRWAVPDDIADDRQVALLVVAEATLLALVYWVVDSAADRRTRRQWETVVGPVIASLRLNLILTQQRLDHAIRHPDDDVTWDAMRQSAEWFLRHTQTNQTVMIVHPDLAAFAPRFQMIAMRLADQAGALNPQQSVRHVANDPGVRDQLEMTRSASAELVADTRAFEERYGALGEPGAE